MSNNARVRQSKGKWASDEDAGDLLAGILDDTAADAEAEQRRIEAELRKREEEEQRKREEEEQRKLMEAEQRLQSEQQRQSQLKQRRTEKMEALRIEDLKARGEWVEPPKPEPKAEEPRAAVAAAPVAAPVAAAPVPLAQQHAPTPEARSGGGNASKILAAVFALVLVAGGVAFGVIQGQYKADTQAYAKTIIAPVDAPDLTAVAAVTFLAEEKPEAAPDEAKKPTKRRYRPRRSSKKPKKTGGKGNITFDPNSLLGGM